VDARPVSRAIGEAKLIDHAAKRNFLRLHQVPAQRFQGFASRLPFGKKGNGCGNILDRDRLELHARELRRKLERQRRKRAHHGTAPKGRRRDHEARAENGIGYAGGCDQALRLALGQAERGFVIPCLARDGDVDQANRAATILDRLQQPLDEIPMYEARVAAGTILKHAEAIDDDIDRPVPQQPRQ